MGCVVRFARAAGAGRTGAAARGRRPDVPSSPGGIIPHGDAEQLRAAGVAAVFTPKDFDITGIIGRIVDEIRHANQLDPLEVPA